MNVVFLSNANSIHLKEWSEYFAHRFRHRVTVLSIPKPTLSYNGVEVIHIGNRMTGNKVFWVALIPRIRRQLHKLQADLFIGYRVVSYGFLAALTRFRPLVLAAQGGNMVWPPKDPLGNVCVRYAVRKADLLNAWSPNIREEMIRYGADPNRILVLSRGIDLSLFPHLPEKHRAPPSIVMTRSLKPSYNVGQLVDAMPLVLRKLPDAVCEVCGDGPLRSHLEQRARDLGVAGAVRFLGQVDRPAIVHLLERAHFYVSTTITDGLPLSHFEAMAAGAFPICTDISANRVWIRDGRNGFLVPVGDAEAVAGRILQAWDDPDLRQRAALANRNMVELEHDRTRNMARFDQIYRSLVAR